jgi:hypothetical protein
MDDALKDLFRRAAIVHGEETETGDNEKSNEAYDREIALVK